jgi:3'-phosphoadenosine 5'-phosphosulfate sulfotransferase (PAPS reductase)/FAD synthetase
MKQSIWTVVRDDGVAGSNPATPTSGCIDTRTTTNEVPASFADPYLIQGPALISFSGGRTSGYMLHEILRAYGGVLPDDVVVAFANTGKEREETLRFVHDCETHWNVKVHWVEWRDAKPCFETVGFNSASRNGEPFSALISKKGYLPNGVTRFCSLELKIRTIRDFCRSLGWDHWKSVVGLRYDEGMRVMKALAGNDAGKERWKTVMPLSKAKVTVRDVKAFWGAQPFDLQLHSYEGNCDLCFLKSAGKLKRLIRDTPTMVDWWKAQEDSAGHRATSSGARFNFDRRYADLEREVATQPFMPGLLDDDEEFDAECGLTCAGDDAA